MAPKSAFWQLQEDQHMAIKRIKLDQVLSGKKELPRKLQFLADAKVAYSAVAHSEDTDEWTVELPLAAAKKLVKAAADLKELKAGQKVLSAQADQVPALLKDQASLAELRESSAATDAELKSARRRVKALEKELGLEPGGKLKKSAAPAPAMPVEPVKAAAVAKPDPAPAPAKAAKPAKATKQATPKAPVDLLAGVPIAPAEQFSLPAEAAAAAEPKKAGPKGKMKPLAKAAKTATKAPALPEASKGAVQTPGDGAATVIVTGADPVVAGAEKALKGD